MAGYREVPLDYNPFAAPPAPVSRAPVAEPAPPVAGAAAPVKYKEVRIENPFSEEPDDTGDFWRGVGNIPGQIQETYGAAKTLAGLLVNSKDLIKSGMESMEEGKQSQTGKESDSFSHAWNDGIGTVLTDWLPYQIGSGIGNIAETLAFMGIGALAGGATSGGIGALPGTIAGAVSKSLIKKGIKEEIGRAHV